MYSITMNRIISCSNFDTVITSWSCVSSSVDKRQHHPLWREVHLVPLHPAQEKCPGMWTTHASTQAELIDYLGCASGIACGVKSCKLSTHILPAKATKSDKQCHRLAILNMLGFSCESCSTFDSLISKLQNHMHVFLASINLQALIILCHPR